MLRTNARCSGASAIEASGSSVREAAASTPWPICNRSTIGVVVIAPSRGCRLSQFFVTSARLAVPLLGTCAPFAAVAGLNMHNTVPVESPAVSIVIPAYRASHCVPDALASVFRQTFTDFEVIVVNDGSPDTAALTRAVAPYSTRVRYIAQTNRGAAAARNTGIRMARGEFIAFLDADDIWLASFLECQMAALAVRPRHALVYCDAMIAGDTALARRRFSE